MGLELAEEEPSSKAPLSGRVQTWAEKYGMLIDMSALIGILVLIALNKLTPAEGLPWLAALLAGRMKAAKAGGVATIAGLGLLK
jgi:hypothetical protein